MASTSSSDQSLSINSHLTSPLLTSSMLSRTSSSSSAVGDYIGTESCFDVLSADEENDVVSPQEPLNRFRYGGRRREEREARAAAAREFPPSIPLLAQTENLLPHMPWVLKRVVTSDGRLILREEKVRHHERATLAAVVEETAVESGGMVGGGGGSPRGKCLKSCFVGIRPQEIRPVLS
ncbi:hypothetical protein HID58_035040 [Brassica napus]|uniref:FAF domain-containing protein n=1 Tax=Brassica napus TaxID=3708 RepID=A0ABQ8C3R8_BRANA|nr:hypothetical protein HID58_035040 [Brassica napus]